MKTLLPTMIRSVIRPDVAQQDGGKERQEGEHGEGDRCCLSQSGKAHHLIGVGAKDVGGAERAHPS